MVKRFVTDDSMFFCFFEAADPVALGNWHGIQDLGYRI